jgi:exportin-2 (importin alpha re-exporter)
MVQVGVVIPDVGLRDHEMEQLEDEPLESILLHLAFGGSASEVAARRQAAADVLQALVSSGYQAEATEIVGSWITSGLQQYNSNPAPNWKAKPRRIVLYAYSPLWRQKHRQHRWVGVVRCTSLLAI